MLRKIKEITWESPSSHIRTASEIKQRGKTALITIGCTPWREKAVGYFHSSDDAGDNITPEERREITFISFFNATMQKIKPTIVLTKNQHRK